jgi:large subunit ribosomal protein L14e
MIEIGRLCKKLAGRDANNYCVVVQKLDENYVLIDGNVRRRKCNVKHLAIEKSKLELKEGASTKEVQEAFRKAKLEVVEKVAFRGPGIAKPAGKKAEKKPEAKQAEPELEKAEPKNPEPKQAEPKAQAKKAPAKKAPAKKAPAKK